MKSLQLPPDWNAPPTEFSPAPFWFWNDALDENELRRQMDEFKAHGVDAFVLHPRVGLPLDTGWMSDKLLYYMRFAIEEARRRGMWVILYDEGMYPSGSSSGQVVVENPAFQCRGLVRLNLDTLKSDSVQQGIKIDENGQPVLTRYQSWIATIPYRGQRYAIIQRPVDAVIRGLHFLNEDSDEPPEESPPAVDLLNPDAVSCFIRLVYDRYFNEFGVHFGETVRAIFTDEPMLLGRLRETGIVPGTADILPYVNDFLGYDFTPFLPALWDDAAPEHIQQDYERALENRLEATYYAQLYDWCDAHNIALTGHPAEPDATRHLRYFHIPGQDIVWRHIEPDQPSAIVGRPSTQAKAAASMMLHTGRRRNANEFCGAYGHELTYDEMCWLANWLLVRGCNLLIPHAFYYSVRGPRYHERPPDVGLHSAWWGEPFAEFARASRRLCWLNTDSVQVCHVAILGGHHRLPWRAARDCLERQIDFNYLDVEDLPRCKIGDDGTLQLAGQTYHALIVDDVLTDAARQWLDDATDDVTVIYWTHDTGACVDTLQRVLPPSPFDAVNAPGLRVRHVRKAGYDWYIVFNETQTPVDVQLTLPDAFTLDPRRDEIIEFDGTLRLEGHELRVLVHEER